MTLPSEQSVKDIIHNLQRLSDLLTTYSAVGFNDPSKTLEKIAKRFFNALYGLDLVNLNSIKPNYPAADLGNTQKRIAYQITIQKKSDKITDTANKAVDHNLIQDFDEIRIFFLLKDKPNFPTKFTQPQNCPIITPLDITDIGKELNNIDNLNALQQANQILIEEYGQLPQTLLRKFELGNLDKYKPKKLVGRDAELALLDNAWSSNQPFAYNNQSYTSPRVLSFIAQGGEGKTSLISTWLNTLADNIWPSCDAVFVWSFYDQGANDNSGSADLFFEKALDFFGHVPDPGNPIVSSYEKGKTLARLIASRRVILILDGLEPLQYPPNSLLKGELKDLGLFSLLKSLINENKGLCIITTRSPISKISTTEIDLQSLPREFGVELLKILGVKGSDRKNLLLNTFDPHSEKVSEYEKLVHDSKGHALTLTIIGSFLNEAFNGDIRKRDCINFEEADKEEQNGHAFRAMDAYVQWLQTPDPESPNNHNEQFLSILRLLGLFDRPADAPCLNALWSAPPIQNLTDSLVNLQPHQRNIIINRLKDAHLITATHDTSNQLLSIDAHPLLREYFADQIKINYPEAWQEAHLSIYNHLASITIDQKPKPTLQDLQHLYQAIPHGCHAGIAGEACNEIFKIRIRRYDAYSIYQLGAFDSDLCAIACFFKSSWSELVNELCLVDQAFLMAECAFALLALGRLIEAREPLHEAAKIGEDQGDWANTSKRYINLSELEQKLGNTSFALSYAKESVFFADQSKKMFLQIVSRISLADIHFQSGNPKEAQKLLDDTNRLKITNPENLNHHGGFWFSDHTLTPHEQFAWKMLLQIPIAIPRPDSNLLNQVICNTKQSLAIFEKQNHLILIALDHLTLARVDLYKSIINVSLAPFPSESKSRNIQNIDLSPINTAVSYLRQSSRLDFLPRGLLTRSIYHFLNPKTGSDSAFEDLEEAWDIADRSGMLLHKTDILLTRARLFFREKEYHWKDSTPQQDLQAAEKLIQKTGYHRRDQELVDAKKAILGI